MADAPKTSQGIDFKKDSFEFQIQEQQKKTVLKNGVEIDVRELGLFDRLNEWVVDASPVNIKNKVIFYRLLATMINAGVSLVKSMQILYDQFEDAKMKKICHRILQGLQEGNSLSDCLNQYPDTFEDAELGMISSGEVSGRLNFVLLNLAERVEENAKIKAKIKGALMYPIAILVVLAIVLTAVLILVIPPLKETFEKAGANLPTSTQILIAMSNALTGTTLGIPNLALWILGVIAFMIGLKIWKKTTSGKYHWDNLMLHLPIFGNLIRKVVLTQFCQSISSLISSGVSITKAIVITSQTVGNEVYRRRILFIGEDVKQGIPMADNIRENKKMFPVMLTSMIEVGEKTAELDKVTQKVADFYKDEVETMVKTLSSLMEPFIIVVIGGVVGFIVAAIMQPIMMLSEVASQAS